MRTVGGVLNLVGRTGELDVCLGLVAALRDGRGGSVWIEGEPGIGKSSLLAEVVAHTSRLGCPVLAGAAEEADHLFVMRGLLAALEVRLDSPDPARTSLAKVLWSGDPMASAAPRDVAAIAAESIIDLVQRLCANGPVLLAMDDLQWADETSLGVWARLHRIVPQLPLLLVGVCRPVPRSEAMDRLRRTVAAGPTPAVFIELGPLAGDEVAEQVARLVGAPARPRLREIAARASGNPLYVRELVDALRRDHQLRADGDGVDLVDGSATVPPSLTAAINARLGFVSTGTRETLRLAAVLGADFSVMDLSALTGEPASRLTGALAEAVAAGILAASGVGFAFRHALLRQALYEAMPATLRVALHHDAAKALAKGGGAAENVAAHLLVSENEAISPQWTVSWLADAGPTLIARAPASAVALLDRVRQVTGAAEARRNELDAQLTAALFQLGQYSRLIPLARGMLARPLEADVIGRVTFNLAYALRRTSEYEQALAATGSTLTNSSLPPLWTARLRALQALILCAIGRFDDAEVDARSAIAQGERVGDLTAIGIAMTAQAGWQSLRDGDTLSAVATVNHALTTLGEDPETIDLRFQMLGNLAATLGNAGRVTEAVRAARDAVALAERAGALTTVQTLRVRAAEACFYAGQWDDAVTDAQINSIEGDEGIGHIKMWGHGVAALIAVFRDDEELLARHLNEMEGSIREGDEFRRQSRMLLLAQAFAGERDGNATLALARLVEIYSTLPGQPFDQLDELIWIPDVVRLALSVGDTDTASAANEACQAEATREPIPESVAAARHCRALLNGDADALVGVAEAFAAIGHPLFEARAWDNAGIRHAEIGELTGARAAYTRARHLYDALEASWCLRRLDLRMRPYGIRAGVRGPRKRPTLGWEALTRTEVRVAELVAAGRSNPDIATTLFLSRRTVETHVSHVLMKLQARSRVDIARRVMRHADAAEVSS